MTTHNVAKAKLDALRAELVKVIEDTCTGKIDHPTTITQLKDVAKEAVHIRAADRLLDEMMQPKSDLETALSVLTDDKLNDSDRILKAPPLITDAIEDMKDALSPSSHAANPARLPWRADDKGRPYTAQMAEDVVRHYNLLYETGSRLIWRDKGGYHTPLPEKEDMGRLVTEAYEYHHVIDRGTRGTMIDYIRHMSGYEIDQTEWDADPDAVYTLDGVVSISTGKLKPYSEFGDGELPPARLRVPVHYDPKAPVPKPLIRYLGTSLEGDPNRILPLLEFWAQCLNPNDRLPYFYILVGEQGTGKSTAIHVANALVGGLCTTSASLQQLGDTHGGEALEGVYLCINRDMDTEHPVESVSIVKAAVTGETFFINPKGRPGYDIKDPRILFCFSMNRLPIMPKDPGLYRRMVPIRFTPSLDEKIGDLVERLTTPEALSGIFNLLLIHLRRIRRTREPAVFKTVHEVKAEVSEISNNLTAFKEQCLDFDPSAKMPKAALKKVYHAFCTHKHVKPIRVSELLSWMDLQGVGEGGIGPAKSRRKAYVGVHLTKFGSDLIGSAGPQSDQTTLAPPTPLPASTPTAPPDAAMPPNASDADTKSPPGATTIM